MKTKTKESSDWGRRRMRRQLPATVCCTGARFSGAALRWRER